MQMGLWNTAPDKTAPDKIFPSYILEREDKDSGKRTSSRFKNSDARAT